MTCHARPARRRSASRLGPGQLVALFAALLTFGLYPALIWPLRFRQVIDAERVRFPTGPVA